MCQALRQAQELGDRGQTSRWGHQDLEGTRQTHKNIPRARHPWDNIHEGCIAFQQRLLTKAKERFRPPRLKGRHESQVCFLSITPETVASTVGSEAPQQKDTIHVANMRLRQ